MWQKTHIFFFSFLFIDSVDDLRCLATYAHTLYYFTKTLIAIDEPRSDVRKYPLLMLIENKTYLICQLNDNSIFMPQLWSDLFA
jgi:hypothetical protein